MKLKAGDVITVVNTYHRRAEVRHVARVGRRYYYAYVGDQGQESRHELHALRELILSGERQDMVVAMRQAADADSRASAARIADELAATLAFQYQWRDKHPYPVSLALALIERLRGEADA